MTLLQKANSCGVMGVFSPPIPTCGSQTNPATRTGMRTVWNSNLARSHSMIIRVPKLTHTYVRFKPVLNWANVSSRTLFEVFGEASWFLIGLIFLREPIWKYLSKLYSGSKKLRSPCSGNSHRIQ